MAMDAASGCKFLPVEREAYRRVGYMRVRQHALGTAQRAFINWLRAVSRAKHQTT
jgi:hypothetical protein